MSKLEYTNREMQALYWEQLIAEACDADLGNTCPLGNPMREQLTLGNLIRAGLMPDLWRGAGRFASAI